MFQENGHQNMCYPPCSHFSKVVIPVMFAKHCNENLTAVSGVHNHHAGTLNGVKDYI